MHAAQMISFLNIYILIIESLFYSLTLKFNVKNTNIFRLKVTLKRVSKETSFAKIIKFKIQNVEDCLIYQIEIRKRKST